MSGAWEFWVDRGGTFTDLVAKTPTGQIKTHKLLSENPDRYKDAAVQGVRDLMGINDPNAAIPDASIHAVKMGTTVATNALLERKGVPVLLMITKGFHDLLRIGNQSRPQLFDLHIRRPDLLYTQVAQMDERLDADGQIIKPLDKDAAQRALQAAYDAGIRAVAIAGLHAYLNPAHELAVAELAAQIGYTQISCSHQVSRLAKLAPRGDTTVVDAYLSPILRRYVQQVTDALDLGRACDQLLFMQSSGGLTDASLFEGKDAILSGPAGGIVGMAKTAQIAGFDQVIGFDMGGTSTDVSHYAGTYERSFETEVAGVRMRAPMMDIHTVAAGGGSICAFEDGRLQVGPHSAGANPGPAAYGRGGPLTVTDCNVILGKLSPAHFPPVFGPNGDQPLDTTAAKSRAAELSAQIAAATGQPAPDIEELAQGCLRIATDNMANAIKKISVERGKDVTGYTLQCFGGAGGQHACLVAEALGMARVFIHPFAGVLSAFGMGLAEIRALREQQIDSPLAQADLAPVTNALRTEAEAEVARQTDAPTQCITQAHLRYEGSYQTLEVALDTPQAMQAAFEAAHLARFGFTTPERELVVDMISVEAVAQTDDPKLPPPQMKQDPIPADHVMVHLNGNWHSTPLYNRADLPSNWQAEGPMIITEPTGTNMVEPGWSARVDDFGNLILDRSADRAQSQNSNLQADPVRLEVFNNLFMSIADQMGATLANTSWSVNIKERLDFSCAIFDGAGDLVANAPHVPVHLGSMSDSIKTVIRDHGDRVQAGDAFMLNSPYNGGTHLPDVTVVSPVFVDGRAVFWLGSRGHHADIGGRTPGSAPPDSQHIDEEGVLIDGLQLVRGGVFQTDAATACLQSGRYPARNIRQNLADLKAQVAANETGKQALLKVIQAQGLGVVQAFMGHVQKNAEDSVRRVIAGLKDGYFEYEMDHGAKICVRVGVDRDARTAVIDFTGTSPQHSGNYNAPKSISRAVVLYVFRTMVGAPIPLNEGCLKPLKIIVPEGSMLNPRYPAAVIAGNTEVSQAACNALYGALGALAASQGTMNNFVWGNDAFQNYETIAGGTGAGPDFDGCDAVQSHMTNTRMTDPEILEKRFPVRLEEFSIAQNTGGTGAHRGGNGALRKLRFLTPVTVTTLCAHRRIAPFGVDGGAPGALGQNWAELPDGQRVDLQGNDEITLPEGAIFAMRTPGGGGWGKP